MRLQKRIWSPLFFANFLRETLIWYIFSVLISKFIFRFSQRLFLSSLFFSSRNIWHSKSIVYLSNLQKHPTKYKKIQKILCKAGRLHKNILLKKILRGNYLLWHDCFFVKRKKYANHIHSSLSLHIQFLPEVISTQSLGKLNYLLHSQVPPNI